MQRLSKCRRFGTYRAARRNACRARGGAWSSDWYVPMHRANYLRGWPVLRHPPGRYPAKMLDLLAAWMKRKRILREARESGLKVMLHGGR